MRRSIVIIAAAILLTATLAGCGLRGGRETTPESTTPDSTSETAPAPEIDLDAVVDTLEGVDEALRETDTNLNDGAESEADEQ